MNIHGRDNLSLLSGRILCLNSAVLKLNSARVIHMKTEHCYALCLSRLSVAELLSLPFGERSFTGKLLLLSSCCTSIVLTPRQSLVV